MPAMAVLPWLSPWGRGPPPRCLVNGGPAAPDSSHAPFPVSLGAQTVRSGQRAVGLIRLRRSRARRLKTQVHAGDPHPVSRWAQLSVGLSSASFLFRGGGGGTWAGPPASRGLRSLLREMGTVSPCLLCCREDSGDCFKGPAHFGGLKVVRHLPNPGCSLRDPVVVAGRKAPQRPGVPNL